jgi:L-cysteine:1D-myo-inositol 2-amino-2-deoxy-alpha-D-glucopyranoside ligase
MSGAASDPARVGSMRLFNTATGEMGAVSKAGQLGVYVCGITPYAAAHIGHAMVYLTYDLLIRRLRDRGRQVTLVRNVTDVDRGMPLANCRQAVSAAKWERRV